MSETIVNVIWGIVCFLGVVNFFAGNGGRGTQAVAFPLIFGAVSYYVAMNHFVMGIVLSSVVGVIGIAILFIILAGRVKKEK